MAIDGGAEAADCAGARARGCVCHACGGRQLQSQTGRDMNQREEALGEERRRHAVGSHRRCEGFLGQELACVGYRREAGCELVGNFSWSGESARG
jgi:hypothetical protein